MNGANGVNGVNGAGDVNSWRANGAAPPPQPAQAPGGSPWAAGGTGGGESTPSPWASVRRPQGKRVTSRERRVVEGLPDWEPLPPGETLVRRPGGTR